MNALSETMVEAGDDDARETADDDQVGRSTWAEAVVEQSVATDMMTGGGGFESAQLATAFRSILDAMARPARPVAVAAAPADRREDVGPMSAAAATTLRVLADPGARVWLGASSQVDAVDRFIRFHAGGAPVADPSQAAFCYGRWSELAALATPIGTPERPDLSATLIVEVDGFAAGPAARLSGPGFDAPRTLAVDGVDDGFWAYAAANAAQFPLGVDFILCAGDRLVGLPRSAKVEPL